MTRREALVEARRRWGSYGSVRRVTALHKTGFQVGEVRGFGWTRVFEDRGVGDSWEAAFAQADERERQPIKAIDRIIYARRRSIQ